MSDEQQNKNLESFRKDTSRMINTIDMLWSDLIYLTDDNSFPDFVRGFCMSMIEDIECAILEKEIKERQDSNRGPLRYTRALLDGLPFKVVNENMSKLLTDINVLFANWLRMIKEAELFEKFSTTPEKVAELENESRAVNDHLLLTGTIERLIVITNRLIAKAEEVLCAVPPSFNISQSYANAIKNSLGE
jgi:hypothetical protein